MTPSRSICRSLARRLAASAAVRDAAPSLPHPIVLLDAVAALPPACGPCPRLVVRQGGDSGLARADAESTVQILVELDASLHGGSASVSEPGPDGVYEFGAGDDLDALVRAAASVVREEADGAILRSLEAEWSANSLPVQSAVLTAVYVQYTAYNQED